MALLGVTRPLERVQPVCEPVEEHLGCEQLRAGGGELERERQTVESVAELRDRSRGGDARSHGPGALAEELHRIVVNERREVELRLALDAQRLAARRDHP